MYIHDVHTVYNILTNILTNVVYKPFLGHAMGLKAMFGGQTWKRNIGKQFKGVKHCKPWLCSFLRIYSNFLFLGFGQEGRHFS